MSITIWDIFKYIYKWKLAIALAVVISILGTYGYVNKKQTYNSTVILQLNDSCILNGNTPDGTKFDYNEIVSPNVLTDVIDDLSLKKTVDSLRTRISITPIIPNTEKEIKEAKEKDGEKYEYYPNTFSITYAGKVGESPNQTRSILESVVDNYISFYNQKYAQLASINDVAYSEEMGSFDYIDMAEMMSENIDDIITTMESYSSRDQSFRSTTTGLNFQDLAKEYRYLEEFDISEIYADIYRGQITKDESLLIKRYTQKKEYYLLDRINFMDGAEVAKTRMDSFSVANENVPNAYNTTTEQNDDNLAIIDQVHEDYASKNATTTYDNLINSYVDNCVSANNLLVKANYCDTVIAKFTAPLDENIDTAALTAEIEANLKSTKSRLMELNKTANAVISDYNNYASTAHVSPLTGVNYYTTISLAIYLLLVVFIVGFMSVIGVLTIEIVKAFRVKPEDEEDVENIDSEEPAPKRVRVKAITKKTDI